MGPFHEGYVHNKEKMSNFLGAFSFRAIKKIYACFWQASPYTGHLMSGKNETFGLIYLNIV